MKHSVPKSVLNTNLEYCINEFVRDPKTRSILRDKWFNKYTIQELAEKYNYSNTTIKRILYSIGDEIIQRASKMNK